MNIDSSYNPPSGNILKQDQLPPISSRYWKKNNQVFPLPPLLNGFSRNKGDGAQKTLLEPLSSKISLGDSFKKPVSSSTKKDFTSINSSSSDDSPSNQQGSFFNHSITFSRDSSKLEGSFKTTPSSSTKSDLTSVDTTSESDIIDTKDEEPIELEDIFLGESPTSSLDSSFSHGFQFKKEDYLLVNPKLNFSTEKTAIKQREFRRDIRKAKRQLEKIIAENKDFPKLSRVQKKAIVEREKTKMLQERVEKQTSSSLPPIVIPAGQKEKVVQKEGKASSELPPIFT